MSMATNGFKQPPPPPPPPPRTLDVRKYAESRAAELNSLHSIISTRLNGDFRSLRHKRRRTTGFNTNKRRRFNKKNHKSNEEEGNTEKKLPRRVRRRIELKKNLETGFTTSGDGTKRLRTHVWHAKRFTMTKFWGFYLPLGLHGRGRGSRALLKWYKQGAVIHDASYYSAVQLEGPEDSLLTILNMLLVPSPSEHSDHLSKNELSGDTYGSAMLHHAGGDISRAICPVTYMWQPFQQQDNRVGTEENCPYNHSQTEFCGLNRRLWIWMHPLAFREGFDCLKVYCDRKANETGVLVDCISLDGQLAQLEIIGSKSFQLLQKILVPFKSSWDALLKSESYLMAEGKDQCELQQKSVIEKTECLSFHAAISLAVVDPRLSSVKSSESVTESQLHCLAEGNPAGNLFMKEDIISNLQSSVEHIANCNDLWMANNGVYPPMDEKFLCLERHKKSLEFFCIKDKTSAKDVTTVPHFSRLCPIILLKNTDKSGLLSGWSIILPVSWVKAFWIPLVSGGAHAIGLREKHWIACDVGLPSFPSDFPDCDAYSSFMAKEADEVDKKMQRRPPDMRPFRVPVPPPWSAICFASDVGAKQNGVDFINDLGNCGNYLTDSNTKPVNDSCEVFVARTSKVLSSFLKEVSGERLLLFPKVHNRKGFSHLMKDDANISQLPNVAISCGHGKRICYVRVLLHAYKKGVIDEGAVICAPQLSDLSLLTSRSEEIESGLQVPHAFVGSYFKELSSGKWVFDLPADPAAREAYRRPIGFVTTGFVRGSKKPSAVGLCEAILLASLRHGQWSQIPAKKRRKEIFVLVRNLRSTAYRLALASIVLEGQDEDVNCL